jgi:hypothetical protein
MRGVFMAKVYIKLFYDFIEMTEPLTHEERGRLVLAMLEYAQNKQVPDDALTGNERVLFPLFRRMVGKIAPPAALARHNSLTFTEF